MLQFSDDADYARQKRMLYPEQPCLFLVCPYSSHLQALGGWIPRSLDCYGKPTGKFLALLDTPRDRDQHSAMFMRQQQLLLA
jgi:hypothetical protein